MNKAESNPDIKRDMDLTRIMNWANVLFSILIMVYFFFDNNVFIGIAAWVCWIIYLALLMKKISSVALKISCGVLMLAAVVLIVLTLYRHIAA